MKNKIRNRWLFGLVAFSIVLCLAFVMMFIIEREAARVKAEEMQTHEVRMVNLEKRTLDATFTMIQGDINYLHDTFKASLAMSGDLSHIQNNWLIYAQRRAIYDQIRYIDVQGNEQIRVNYKGGTSSLVDRADLQNKKDRYYFSEAIGLNSGEFYVSPLDLNLEAGKVELPYKPMIRISMPVYLDDKLEGVIVLNYLADTFLDIYKDLSYDSVGEVYLLNNKGDYLSHNLEDKVWQFMFEGIQDQSFVDDHKAAWQAFDSDQGQFTNGLGQYTYGSYSVYDSILKENTHSNYSIDARDETRWYLVSYVAYGKNIGEFIYDDFWAFVAYVIKTHAFFFIFMINVAILIGLLTYFNRSNFHKIKYHSEIDHLTQMLNRRAGLHKLNDIILRSNQKTFKMSLCYIDINGLKEVNDSLGHEMGDELIKTVAQGIKVHSRHEDFAIRLGGDEFLIAFVNSDLAASEKIWSRIHGAYDVINARENRPYMISVSHGIVDFEHANEILVDDLIKVADEKMYQEKSEIKKNIHILREKKSHED